MGLKKEQKNVKLNADKRSLIFCMTLGDGSLYKSSPSQKNITGYFVCKHGWQQEDYLRWKADLAAITMGRPVNVRSATSKIKKLNKTYQQFTFMMGAKRFRAWRNFTYPNNVKSYSKLLNFIKHPKLAAALWLMDDGSLSTGYPGSNKNVPRVCTGLVLYLGQCFREDAFSAQNWFKRNFKVNPRIRWQKVKYNGTIRQYPELRFTVQDSLVIWKNIKFIVETIPSMMNKFQKLEDRAKRNDLLQPQTLPISESVSEDIVQKIIKLKNN